MSNIYLRQNPRKNFWGPKFGSKAPKSGPELGFFCHFLKFGSLFFLEITYSDSLQQCITSSRGKTHEQNFCRPNLGQNQTQN